MAVSKFTLQFVDAKGQKGGMRFYANAPSAADFALVIGGIQSATTPLTNASYFSSSGSFGGLDHIGSLGTAADYQDITLKAVMVFTDTAGNIHRYGIPSPKRSIFRADGVTVDSTNTDVAAWIVAMLLAYTGPSNVSSRQGAALANFVSGILQKKRQRRRINAFILDPDETEPAE